MLPPPIYLLDMLLSLYGWVIIIAIVLYWLVQLQVVNPYQPFVQRLQQVLARLTEPVLIRIRRVVPPVGGVDLSPIVLLIALSVIRYTLRYYFA